MEEKRKVKSKIVFLCFFLLAVAVGVWYYVTKQNTAENEQGQEAGKRVQDETELISASGATMIGMDRVTFELDTQEAQLVVEEVYISSGEEVEKGSKILKFTEESVEEVQRELSHAAAEAVLNYRQGLLDYELALIEAAQTRDTALLETEYAQNAYDSLLAEAKEEVDKLEEELEAAKELYEEYYNGINNNGYEIEYELEAKKELYETNEALYWATLKKWNIDDSQVNNSSAATMSADGGGQTGGMSRGGSAGNTDAWQITALELLEDTYRANKEDYEQAKENCATAIEAAQAGLARAQAEYERLAMEVEEAKINYEKKAAAGEADYNMAVAEGAVAKSDYQTEVKKQQEALEILADEKEETADSLALFESYAADGYLYTESRGTIMMLMVSKGQTMEADDMILAYSNPELITIFASVDQSNIASVAVGDNAVIVSEEYGNLTGTVTEINPVSNSGGMASVTYTVVITLDETDTQVEANRTVTVYFGMSLEEYEAMSNRQHSNGGAGAGIPSDGSMPTDRSMPMDRNMPTDGTMPANAGMREGESE